MALIKAENSNILALCCILVTVPAPIKDAASIQKIFFQSSTMMQFARFYLSLSYAIAQNLVKTCLFLVFFSVRLLFKSVCYWRGYVISRLFTQ